MIHQTRWELVHRRADPAHSVLHASMPEPLQPGAVELEIGTFGLTANNATYARLGDSDLPFWDVFSAEAGLGRLPVWGTATVVRSRCDAVPVGERYFGFLPMSTHHVVGAPEAREDGFLDCTPARAELLHPWYRTYLRVPTAELLDDLQILLRPLMTAAVTASDFALRSISSGVRTVVVTSASSKTALCTAALLAERSGARLVAVTADKHLGFVRGVGCYDQVTSYVSVAEIATDGPVLVLDLAGDLGQLRVLSEHFGTFLSHIALIGYTHPGAVIEPPADLRPLAEIFFSPHEQDVQIESIGSSAYRQRFAQAEQLCVQAARGWLQLRRLRGPEAAEAHFRRLLAGEVLPDEGAVFRTP